MTEGTQITYHELTKPDVERPMRGVRFPHPSLEDTYEPGVTEPWVQQLVCALLVASGGRDVLETGGFVGITSAWLALTLESMGGGALTVCELDPHRAAVTENRLVTLPLERVDAVVFPMDVLDVIRALPDASLDFVWLDDDHTHDHVYDEIHALWPKMRKRGLIVGHDVHGVCALHQEFALFGGYAIDLPRLGPAGGIGVLQKP